MRPNAAERTVNVLSFGAGVQSTVVCLMMHRGELPRPDAAIFADPGEEHPQTYQHLEWIKREVTSFPIIVASKGTRLGDDVLRKKTTKGERFASIPAFTSNKDGELAMARRQCTSEYKIEVIERTIRRVVLGLKPRQRIPKGTQVVQWFGISAEEAGRALRVRKNVESSGWLARFPLMEDGQWLDRKACLEWLKAYPVPHEVHRSACVFCPYLDNARWLEMQRENGPAWKRALEIDEGLRRPGAIIQRALTFPLFLHRSLVPLREINFEDVHGTLDDRAGQMRFGFNAECMGMCGM